MRVNVHDYSGHPFQVQLSRELARRGHDVLHEYAAQYVTGRGRLQVTADDPPGLRIESVVADRELDKYNAVARARFEVAYAKAWLARLQRESHDLVVACNVPLFALARVQRYFARSHQPWVFWHQDVYSMGVNAEIRRRLPPPVAAPLTGVAETLERAQVRTANRVVAIGEAFVERYRAWGIPTGHVSVEPNWAPLGDVRPGPRDNPWSVAQGLPREPVRLVYTGTLGRKHNPLLLLEVLDAARSRGVAAQLLVCSEGDGADQLAAAAGNRPDVRVLGFQPAECYGEVLASADVLVALLEPDAAVFSVPSKVLSYLSAGRPIIGLMPEGNDAARDVLASGGFVGTPDRAGAAAAGAWVAQRSGETGVLGRIGAQARALAEERFDIEAIADRFESVFRDAVAPGAR